MGCRTGQRYSQGFTSLLAVERYAVRPVILETREAEDLEKAPELSREPGRHLGPAAAIEEKFRQGQGEIRSSAVAEAGEIEDRNGRWESMNWELGRVQEDLGQLVEELRAVERAIRQMANTIADRARRLLDGRQTGQLIRGAFRPSQKPQPERGGARGELPEKSRDRNMCRF